MSITAEGQTLSLQQALSDTSTTHKSQNTGLPVNLEGGVLQFSPEYEGGLAKANLGKTTLYFTVRAPRWRSQEDDPTVRTSDLLLVHGLNNAERTLETPGRIAFELEGLFIANNGDSLSLPIDNTESHPELLKCCREEVTTPTYNLFDAGHEMHQASLRLWRIALDNGGLLYTGANIAHRVLTTDDLNLQHDYIERAVRAYGGKEKLAHCNIAAMQIQHERTQNLVAAAAAYNHFVTVLSPLLAACTAAAPYDKGELNPRYNSTLKGLQTPNGYLSTRYFSRVSLSPQAEAGVPLQLVPQDRDHIASLIDRRMRYEISNPGRMVGHLADRFRVDLSPLGTIEACNPDTNGYEVASSISLAGLSRAFLYLHERSYMTGDIERLAHEYPMAVKLNLTEEDLYTARTNNIRLGIDGFEGSVAAADRHSYPARRYLFEIMRMVRTELPDGPYYLNDDMVQRITLRTRTPKAATMQKDENGLPTAAGFYSGGEGALAHYIRARVEALVAQGYTPPKAIMNANVDVALAHASYLSGFDPHKDLRFLYQQ